VRGDLWDVDGAGPDDKSDDKYRRGMATPAEASASDLAQLLLKRVDAAAPLRSADITDTTVIRPTCGRAGHQSRR
jgi:hypothetical protein